jgi:sugar lactone lactonase YvrE
VKEPLHSKSVFNFVFACALFLLETTGLSQSYAFSTIAGQPGQRATTDGTNNNAYFYQPRCLTVGMSGNLFVTDDTTIRQITLIGTNYIVNTLAGSARIRGGTDGTNGAALFSTPSGIAVDAATNLYVADYDYDTIRKITPSGTNWVVTTLAGVAGVAGSADGAGTNALFNNPFGLFRDNAGNLFVADSGNNTIREISPQGTNWMVTTITGSSSHSGSADGTNTFAQFKTPRDVVVDAAGILYVTDRGNGTIRKITPAGMNWVVTTIAGMAGQKSTVDGTNTDARFSAPDGIALDGAGNLYVSDTTDDVIRQLTSADTNWVVSTVGGFPGNSGSTDSMGTNAWFNYPDNIKVDNSGRLYIADRDNYTIRQGTIAVSSFTFTAASLIDGAFVFGGTNNLPFAAGYLLTSTNLQLPLSQWQSIATNWSDANGSLMFTNNLDPNAGQRFYILQLSQP